MFLLRWLQRAFEALIALLILFEEWGWEPLKRAMARLMRWGPLAWIERAILRLPPYAALVLFLAAGFFAGAAFLAAGLAAAFFTAGFLAAGFFAGAAFLAAGFFAGAAFLAAGFLAFFTSAMLNLLHKLTRKNHQLLQPVWASTDYSTPSSN
jgi:hypothetical protein